MMSCFYIPIEYNLQLRIKLKGHRDHKNTDHTNEVSDNQLESETNNN